eukprot:2951240-Pleurochrysis_carterae.AAC.1
MRHGRHGLCEILDELRVVGSVDDRIRSCEKVLDVCVRLYEPIDLVNVAQLLSQPPLDHEKQGEFVDVLDQLRFT